MALVIAAIGCSAVAVIAYLIFGAHMAARQKAWLPASTPSRIAADYGDEEASEQATLAT